MNQMLEFTDLGADIKVSLEERKKYPSALSISMRNNESEDLFSKLQKSGNEDDRRDYVKKCFDEALNLIEQKKSHGAGLYLQSVAPQDLQILVEESINKIEHWLEGLENVTEDFMRRVSLAEGFYIALCEVLLTVSPDKGKALWRALIPTLTTKFQGAANINEMLQIILRIRSQDELLLELYAIEALNTDKALFELSIAAHLNERRDWLDTIISQDLISGITWRKQRAEKLKGFAIGNVLPVSDAWSDGPIQNQPEQRKVNAAIWRHKEACAKYWWERYWQSSSDEDAYAAWVLFLDVVDRRAYVWMNIEEIKDNKTLPNVKHRLANFYCNFTNLKSAIREQESKLDSEFLGRKIVDSIGPWREQ